MSYGKVNKTTGERIPYAGNSGGGGTSDYSDLTHKPSINGVTLSGNKTSADLGMDYETITYTQWQAMTPAQQESGKWDVTGVPGGGGGGGTTDYSDLINKPSINSVTLSGNKTALDLSLASTTDLAGKQDKYETITYAQWQAMTPAQQAAKDYYISDYPSSQIIAGNVSYSNTSSGMSANNVQGAVDELASEKKDEYTPITYAQWSALTPTQKAAKDYYISDYPASAITAGNVSYNNSSSGLSANNVQSAVDELKSGLIDLTKHNLDSTVIDITSYISGNTYTTPSDGFVRVSASTEAINVVRKNGTAFCILTGTGTTELSAFVKKGTQLFVDNPSTAKFLPYVD